jgi:hypothetical protein
MNDIVGTVVIRSEISGQFVDDVLTTAFEGGINYWCASVLPRNNVWPEGATYASQCLSLGTDLVIVEASEDYDDDVELESHIMTLQDFLNGVQLYCDELNVSVYSLYEDFDASVADCIVQLAIFGRLVYG